MADDEKQKQDPKARSEQQEQQQQEQQRLQTTKQHGQTSSSSQWIPPTTGNPDLDPVGQVNPRIDLREHNPLTPQGMLFDPRQLFDQQRQQGPTGGVPDPSVPPGARFDPFGPPDPSQVGPGRGPPPTSQFGVPDPDHMPPPGQPMPRNIGGKSLKWPPGSGSGFPPPGGAGGSPFM